MNAARLYVPHDSQGCPIHFLAETGCGEKCLTSWKTDSSMLAAEREDYTFDDDER